MESEVTINPCHISVVSTYGGFENSTSRITIVGF